jgi:hypothetical protein
MHPEADARTVHGNVVTEDGIEHLARPWSPEHALVIAGSPAALAIVVARQGADRPAGEGMTVAGLVIDDDLTVRKATFSIRRIGEATWHVEIDDGPATPIVLDEDGIALLDDAESWPLEAAPSR